MTGNRQFRRTNHRKTEHLRNSSGHHLKVSFDSQDDTEMPTETEIAEMDNSIESLKSQISNAREEIKRLTASNATQLSILMF